jgi:DNA-directed RNA polymerase subunit F
MTNPQFIEEKPLSLVDVKEALQEIEKRDAELGYLSNRTKEYLDAFLTMSPKKKEELSEKLLALDLTRLKDEHIMKIVDFLPKDLDSLKAVLQSYPLSLPKKDQTSIVNTVKSVAET